MSIRLRRPRAPRRSKLKVRQEAEHIQKLALRGDARIIKARTIILMSTRTGDAWALDPEDNLALCLARERQVLPIEIKETGANFEVVWNARYRLEGDTFHFMTQDGAWHARKGYPLEELFRFSALIKKELKLTKPVAPVTAKPNEQIGRNDACPCGSGKKYKKCCLPKDEEKNRASAASASPPPAPAPDSTPPPALPPAPASPPPGVTPAAG